MVRSRGCLTLVRPPGFEPGLEAWQAPVLTRLDHGRLLLAKNFLVSVVIMFFLVYGKKFFVVYFSRFSCSFLRIRFLRVWLLLPNFSSRNWWRTWIFLTRFSFPIPVSFFRWKSITFPVLFP